MALGVDSRLRHIESCAFLDSALEPMTVPQDVDFINASTFLNIINRLISIEAGNSHFIVDSSGWKLIRYFVCANNVTIPCNIEILLYHVFRFANHFHYPYLNVIRGRRALSHLHSLILPSFQSEFRAGGVLNNVIPNRCRHWRSIS
jgi:hypothetical protein